MGGWTSPARVVRSGALDASEIDAILTACERALASGARLDLKALGFWRAVDAVKRDPGLVEPYASRIATIDRRAFLARVRPVFPLWFGVAVLLGGTIAGLVLLAAAFALPPGASGVATLLGAGALLGTTHDLAHLVAGRVAGIRFTHWFMDVPRRPQPGVKIDYASYLRAPASARAWMHASGAIVSKLVPFLIVPVAVAAPAPWWTSAILIAIGVVSVVTDALFSVRASDWKKFRREMRFARGTR